MADSTEVAGRAGQDERAKDLGFYPKRMGATEIFRAGTDMAGHDHDHSAAL